MRVVCGLFKAIAVIFVTGCSLPGFSQNDPLFTGDMIDDEKVYRKLETEARRLVDEKSTVSLADLASQLERERCTVAFLKPATKTQTASGVYAQARKSVLIIGTLFKCSHCPNDHLRAASGFVIAENGIGVTSYHIFRGHATNEQTDITVVVMDAEGRVFPVREVLAASKGDDIAIFRFDAHGEKIPPLPLGNNALAGDDALVIGHPHNMYYSFTKGTVSRMYQRDGGPKMSITADFSQGSSGGPVLDTNGNIIGVVSATRSLYNDEKHVQMVSRETIPVRAIRSLIIK